MEFKQTPKKIEKTYEQLKANEVLTKRLEQRLGGLKHSLGQADFTRQYRNETAWTEFAGSVNATGNTANFSQAVLFSHYVDIYCSEEKLKNIDIKLLTEMYDDKLYISPVSYVPEYTTITGDEVITYYVYSGDEVINEGNITTYTLNGSPGVYIPWGSYDAWSAVLEEVEPELYDYLHENFSLGEDEETSWMDYVTDVMPTAEISSFSITVDETTPPTSNQYGKIINNCIKNKYIEKKDTNYYRIYLNGNFYVQNNENKALSSINTVTNNYNYNFPFSATYHHYIYTRQIKIGNINIGGTYYYCHKYNTDPLTITTVDIPIVLSGTATLVGSEITNTYSVGSESIPYAGRYKFLIDFKQ